MRTHVPTIDLTEKGYEHAKRPSRRESHDEDPVRKMVRLILLLAIKDRASELRFEPDADELRLSYVIDGTPHDLVPPPTHLGPAIARAVREMAMPSRSRRWLADRLRRWAGSLDGSAITWQRLDFRVRTGTQTFDVHAYIGASKSGEAVHLHLSVPGGAAAWREAQHVLKSLLESRRTGADNDPAVTHQEPSMTMTVPTLTPPKAETIEGAGEDIWRRRHSCLDVLEACLDRIDEWEPKVHAWVFVDHEGARDQARALDEELAAGQWRGPLHGIPVGIKDIIDVVGLPTACGSPLGADGVAAEDSPIVDRLRKAGAVIVGKMVTTPYAWIDPPPTRNPWDLDRTPGGSSSGPAAAVACGMVLAALGSQTGGSITRPAAYCGVAGLKPTHGRLPLEGILPLAPSLDHPGPIARTVGDLERLWLALAESDPRDIPAPSDDRPIRLGLPRGFFDDRIEPAMREAMTRAVETLRAAGVEVVEVDLPEGFARDVPRDHRLIMATEAAAVHRDRLADRPDAYPPRITALIEEGLTTPATAYVEALQHKEATWKAMRASFDGIDALLTPAALGPAPDTSTTGDPLLNSPWSYTGLPTVSLPSGISPDRLPLAIQLVGRPFGEAGLLRIGSGCESILR